MSIFLKTFMILIKIIMKFFLIFSIILIQIQTRTRIYLDRFTGCTSDLFVNPANFKILKIDYSIACTNLESCAEDETLDHMTCIKNFQDDMASFCDSYTSINGWRRRYCHRIAKANLVLALKLDVKLFKSFIPTKKFTAFIAETSSLLADHCLDTAVADKGVTCDGTVGTQNFTFVELNNNKWVIEDSAGSCLNNAAESKPCDYTDEFQQFLLGDGTVNGAVTIQNVGSMNYWDIKDTPHLDASAATDVFLLGVKPINVPVVADDEDDDEE